MKSLMDLEICVESVESAIAAEDGGAQRVELCSSLAEGGITPSAGLIQRVRARVNLGIHVMIRPRGGDFVYSDEELAVMRSDIEAAAHNGADGVVLGLLTPEGHVDVETTRALVELARPMQVTFHRAIDMASEPEAALQDVIDAGADRILTSGSAQTALLGAAGVASLVRAARGRISIMVCGGVRPENVQEIARLTGVDQFHAALRTLLPSPVTYRKQDLHLGDPEIDAYDRMGVRVEDVRELRRAIDGVLLEGIAEHAR